VISFLKKRFSWRSRREYYNGPYIFCDYWVSVLGLRNILNPLLVLKRLVSPELYRKALDRPKARLPKLRYYILATFLGPAFLPYKVAFDLAVFLRPRRDRKIPSAADKALQSHRLKLSPAPGGGGRWVRVASRQVGLDDEVLNPDSIPVAASFFYPTHKVLIAALITLGLSVLILPHTAGWTPKVLPRDSLEVVFYVLLFTFLYFLFKDIWTALLAPVPLFVVKQLIQMSGGAFTLVLGMGGIAFLFFLVEWFFIPQPMPPTLFLYVNDPKSSLFPYRKGHAPYWLEGKYYWVWRFVTHSPGQVNRFWERDWERMEVWVRADRVREAGRVEWIVTDCHYRELWFPYERLVEEKIRHRQISQLGSSAEKGEEVAWVIETDANLLFHNPFLRGIFLSRRKGDRIQGNVKRILKTLFLRLRRDDPRPYKERLEELETRAGDLFADVPELFRNAELTYLFKNRWSFWRYPYGAATSARSFFYSGEPKWDEQLRLAAPVLLQIKADTYRTPERLEEVEEMTQKR